MPDTALKVSDIPVEVGEQVQFSKTIGEADITLFAGLSGDFHPIHMDAVQAAKTPYGRRIAHGALMMALLSAASSEVSYLAARRGAKTVPVSLGYDKIRFVAPAFINDTLTARYSIASVDLAAGRSYGKVEVLNQDGKTLLAGTHVMRWLQPVAA